jgi:TPR repeat protein
MYRNGQGVNEDLSKAFEIYKEGEEKGKKRH